MLAGIRGEFLTDPPGDTGWHQVRRQGMEVCPGGQYIRRADRIVALTRWHEPTLQGGQQMGAFTGGRTPQPGVPVVTGLTIPGHRLEHRVHGFVRPVATEHMQTQRHLVLLHVGQVVADLVHEQLFVHLRQGRVTVIMGVTVVIAMIIVPAMVVMSMATVLLMPVGVVIVVPISVVVAVMVMAARQFAFDGLGQAQLVDTLAQGLGGARTGGRIWLGRGS